MVDACTLYLSAKVLSGCLKIKYSLNSTLSFSSNDLKVISTQLNLPMVKTEFFTQLTAKDVLDNAEVFNLIFENENRQVGSVINLIELSDDLSVLIEIIDFEERRPKSFEETKGQVKNEFVK